MEVTKTTQGRNKVLPQGYAYVKQKKLANGWESYECERGRLNNPLPVPLTRNNIPNPLPPNYLIANDGRPFLAWDSGDASRILLFITAEKLTLLEQSLHWFIDGTFDTVPLIYSQLFIIHALTMGTVIVCGLALLPNKIRPTYVRLFQELHNMNQNLNPLTVLIDFEVAVKNDLEVVFPGVDVKGC